MDPERLRRLLLGKTELPPPPTAAERERIRRRRRSGPHACPLCRATQTMFWKCGCGFEMCGMCRDENAWGMTCNDLTWTCPDCGRQNSF